MARFEVHKFGGTSVEGAARLASVAAVVAGVLPRARVVVVASAMAGVTNRLIEAAAATDAGDRGRGLVLVQDLLGRHEDALALLRGPDDVRADLRRICAELSDLVRGASLLGELTARTRDRMLAAGERMSVRLLAVALRAAGVPAVAMDADGFLETDDRFGSASPLRGVTDRAVAAALRPVLDRGEVPVVTGFVGRAPDGATTTLGRGGSDYTATLIAAALGADEVTIWTDVDGVRGADPGVAPDARVVPQLNFREAAEMSYYGARVLHPRTVIPVASAGIPLRVRNSLRPDAPGTVVDGRFTPGSHPVKAISAVHGQCLVSIEGKGMAGVPGVAARAFRALADKGISVTMISQSSSESSMCLAVPGEHAVAAEAALKREFRGDLSAGDVEDVVVRPSVSLVAAVGLGMARTPGVAARVFSSVASRRVNVLAIAQGSSELNISFAVDRAEADEAVRAVHREFGLDRIDTGVDSPRGLDVLLLGPGKVGRAFASLLAARAGHLRERFGLEARVVAVADRSGFLLRPAGLSAAELERAIAAKGAGERIGQADGAERGDPAAMLREALSYRLGRPVLVDTSDWEGASGVMAEALRRGCDVVTANKKPLAGTPEAFRDLVAAASAAGRLLRAEATVGAGLPVMDTLDMLLSTGDRVEAAEGALSGTLQFVGSRLEEGVALSAAVEEAIGLGYTEPDAAEDLSGADVGRKALILARLSGLAPDASARVTPMVPDLPPGLSRDALLAAVRAHDTAIAARVRDARARGCALRYVASVRAGSVEAGPVEVPADSPVARARGTENVVVFRSDRYRDRPLAVSGPGAGVEVTAMGVLSDVFRVAAERR